MFQVVMVGNTFKSLDYDKILLMYEVIILTHQKIDYVLLTELQ